ncbi:hypothetical protein K490DRAFT_51224 [Saccharata proteae CBS 121410]|uniref:Nucleoporin NUP53 n=1 Tax=Saccharata proteae CBS 121410 TaxID=1314787 RepID=A0A9P4HQN1_9PEZI|nr:hypothetical protein K490DRAFT_51224 [Saccharata proteae CBS 121410]
MQVHAVPDSERAFDASGRQLPWAYEYADPEHSQRRHVEEKGPFGRSTRRRGLSRSKTTGTPARKEDLAKIENLKLIDDLFTQTKAPEAKQPSATGPTQSLSASPVVPSGQVTSTKEPTEVILYGYSSETQWAAIEYYERVSSGFIYEDYERHPPHSKYNQSLSLTRAALQGNLSAAALRKKNTYAGGVHWIKVTFDSPEAADLACHYSPHTIHGHAVFAELFRGTGPQRGDTAIPATQMGAAAAATESPAHSSTTFRNDTASPSTSDTASSATVRENANGNLRQRGSIPSNNPKSEAAATANAKQDAPQPAAGRIRGARRAILRPAEQALLPVGSWWQQRLGNTPIIGMFVGTGIEVIGSEVPRKEDGSFDKDNASFYWKIWAFIDACLKTDFLGLGTEE